MSRVHVQPSPGKGSLGRDSLSVVSTLPLEGEREPSAPAAAFLSALFGSAGSSPPSSQNATLPSSGAWPLSASSYSRSFSSIAPAPSIAGTHLASRLAGRPPFLPAGTADRPSIPAVHPLAA